MKEFPMPKIIDHVLSRKKEINEDAQEARANQQLAELAVIGGITSNAWRVYMRQFCDKDANGVVNDVQLRRLTALDNGNQNFNRNRAYLVANGMCGDFTKAHFEENVQSIDDGLTFPGSSPGCFPNA
jgi:hypothetical protein